jgi:hypothetical protein
MLVNYKKANIMAIEIGVGKSKLVLVPGVNVLDDTIWKDAEKNLESQIKAGTVVPIYKVTKKTGKDGKETETKEPVTPDEIPNNQLDSVINEIQSENEADKFINASTKESVRAKAANRKNAIAKEIEDKKKD